MTEPTPLSEREKEVLQLVAQGLTNREISQRLSISPNTVKVHLRNIFEKTGVASRTEATVYAIEQRIVAVPGGEAAQPEEQTGWRWYVRTHPWVGLGGGFLAAAVALTILFVFVLPAQEPEVDPATLERWQELAPMPEARVGLAAVAYDNQIYAIAGEGPEGVSGSVFRYDIETDAWERLSDKPVPVTDVDGVLIGEKIYVPGGRLADGQPTDVLEIYDPRKDAWTRGAALPEAVSSYALTEFEGQLYLFGGWDGGGALKAVFIYDPVMDIWKLGMPMAVAKYDAEAVSLTDKIAVLGGRNELEILSLVQVYFPSRDVNGETPWEDFVNLSEERYGFGAASIYDSIYVIGGISENGSSEMLPAYQFIDGKWQSIQAFYDNGLSEAALVPIGSSLFLLSPDMGDQQMEFWHYQAYYFEIFIPIVD